MSINLIQIVLIFIAKEKLRQIFELEIYRETDDFLLRQQLLFLIGKIFPFFISKL